MKKVYLLSIVIILIFEFSAFGQNKNPFNSIAEIKSDWELGTSWTGGVSPGTIDVQNVIITIQGYISRNGNLSFKNNADLVVDSYDTLVIAGDLLFQNTTTLTIKDGAVLVVTGNFTSNNNINVDASGSLVVLGNFISGNNTSIDFAGDGAMYVIGTFDAGQNTTVTGGEVEGEAALESNTALAEFINQIAPGKLPVTLLYFKASAQSSTVEINWASSKAWDFSHYELERSENGKDFFQIATIDAEENSNETVEFSFVDYSPVFGTSYYRLKAVDIDGKYEYKGIEVVKFGAESFKVYPNPSTSGFVTVDWSHSGEGATAILKDHSGRTLRSANISVQNNKLDTSNLPAGMYLLTVQGAAGKQQTQLIIR